MRKSSYKRELFYTGFESADQIPGSRYYQIQRKRVWNVVSVFTVLGEASKKWAGLKGCYQFWALQTHKPLVNSAGHMMLEWWHSRGAWTLAAGVLQGTAAGSAHSAFSPRLWAHSPPRDQWPPYLLFISLPNGFSSLTMMSHFFPNIST